MLIPLVYGASLIILCGAAWALGANDAANPTDCAVGAGVISIRKALTLFALMVAVGGILIGPFVMKTFDKKMVDRPAALEAGVISEEEVVLGSLTSAGAGILWVVFSTWKGMPVSTTHSILGGVLGYGLVAAPAFVKWDVIRTIGISIVLSPVLALVFAWLFYIGLNKYAAKERGHLSSSLLLFIMLVGIAFSGSFVVLTKTLHWGVLQSVLVSSAVSGIIASSVVFWFIKSGMGRSANEKAFRVLLIISLAFSAFAFGANDMANATGVFVTPTEVVVGTPGTLTMVMLAALGALFIAVGGFTWGYRVIQTSGFKITRLDPVKGLSAEFSNALGVFLFTTIPQYMWGFGIPVSTTHSSIGSIIGTGLASKGLRGIDHGTTARVFLFWILTLPCAALLSAILFWLSSGILL